MYLLNKTLAQLAQELPGATSVFDLYGLSICSDGNKALEVAIQDKGIEQQAVITDLSKLTANSNRLAHSENETLALVQNFHLNWQVQMDELSRMAERVEVVHGNNPDCPSGLADKLITLSNRLLSHSANVTQSTSADPLNKIDLTENTTLEHENLLLNASKIEKMVNNFQPPGRACNTWKALYFNLEFFIDSLKECISFEKALINNQFTEKNEPKNQPTKPAVHGENGVCCGSCGGQ